MLTFIMLILVDKFAYINSQSDELNFLGDWLNSADPYFSIDEEETFDEYDVDLN
jgi:hypothetical protein